MIYLQACSNDKNKVDDICITYAILARDFEPEDLIDLSCLIGHSNNKIINYMLGYTKHVLN